MCSIFEIICGITSIVYHSIAANKVLLNKNIRTLTINMTKLLVYILYDFEKNIW